MVKRRLKRLEAHARESDKVRDALVQRLNEAELTLMLEVVDVWIEEGDEALIRRWPPTGWPGVYECLKALTEGRPMEGRVLA